MPYTEKEYQLSNVNYLNKDFSSLKSSLIEYAKTYFPNSYRDFNETSPGMMLIEMSAYVGDVLSFYIDNQYKEMLLPLAEERRNIVNMANMLGYKVKPITPAYVDISISQTVGVTGDIDNLVPNYSADSQVLPQSLKITSTSDSTIIFETLDIVDFTVSGGLDSEPLVSDTDSNGVVTEYTLTRKVKAVSGETKTKTFSIGSPEKFKRITLPETNIVEILNVTDSNGNKWYKVDYLAQDKVPSEEHYSDSSRDTAYTTIANEDDEDESQIVVPIPYTLEYIKVPKRFITEINDDNTTSLVFGNGILHSSATSSLSDGFYQTEQVGWTIPGETENITSDISPILGSVLSSLGEAPSNTTLTITYRVGGGISANVPAGDLTSLDSGYTAIVTGNAATPTLTNIEPARGGANEQSVEEIKRKAQAHFTTQRRCVTKEDYEARVLAIPAKFGNIAKVSVNRAAGEGGEILIPSVEIHTLSYDNNKNLVDSPDLLMNNLRNYLNEFRIISDEFVIYTGKVVNFGVAFEVVAHKYASKHEVKLRCINKIIDYFNIDKMKFRQPIYTSELIYELMGIEGVRSVNHVELTQNEPSSEWTDSGIDFGTLYSWTIDPANGAASDDGTGYGYQYDFSNFYDGAGGYPHDGTILPSIEPSVFELKKPNENVKGVVL